MSRLVTEVSKIEETLERLNREYGLRLWNYYTRGGCINLEDLDQKMKETVFNDRILEAIKENIEGAEDLLQKRRLNLLKERILLERLKHDDEIRPLLLSLTKRKNEYTIEGQKLNPNQANIALLTSPNRNFRHKIWRAYREAHHRFFKEIINLNKLVDKKIKDWGYVNIVDFKLCNSDVNPDRILKEIEIFENETHCIEQKFWEDLSSFLKDTPKPWDKNYYLYHYKPQVFDRYFPEDRALESLKEVIDMLGFNFNTLPISIDCEPRPEKKHTNAYTFDIHVPDDIRISINYRPGRQFFKALYHEFGHALYLVHIKTPYYVFRSQAPCLGEGMAEAIAKILDTEEWISRFTNMDKETKKSFKDYVHLENVLWTRGMCQYFLFEHHMHQNLNQNLDDLWINLSREFTGLEIERDEVCWASNDFLINPFSHKHSYPISQTIAKKIHNTIRKRFGSILNRSAREFLIDIYEDETGIGKDGFFYRYGKDNKNFWGQGLT
jgi:oligoendopeptidase F